MKQTPIGLKGRVTNLQTVIKKNQAGELEVTFKFSSPDIEPRELQRLFQAQQAGNLEFSITSQQLELFSGKDTAGIGLPLN